MDFIKKSNKKKVLVTGGAGFIGSHLVENLVKSNFYVVVFDNLSTGIKQNIKSVYKEVKFVNNDIRNFAALKRAMKDAVTVYHLAAISSVPYSVDNPIETSEVNIIGTQNVLEAARQNNVKRVVYVSSASVYGSENKVPFKESMIVKGSSPYALSKLIGEQLCDLYLNLYKLETVSMRFFSVYGPRQNPRSQYSNVIPSFATKVLSNVEPIIYGDGKQTRDFVFVGDIVKAFRLAARKKSAVGEVFNVGPGELTSVNDLLAGIQEILKTNIKPKYLPKKPGDDPCTLADPTKVKNILGLKKFQPFQEGLKKTILWFKENYS